MSEEKKLNGTVIVTYRCNARCSMCNRYKAPSKPEEEISLETIKKLPKMYFTNITGGEPFIRTDLKDIVRELYKKSDRIVISTNGFFTDRIVDLCKEFPQIGIRISIEGLEQTNNEIRGLQNGYQRGYGTLKKLREMGMKDVGFGMTVQDKNAPDLVPLYKISNEMGMEFATASLHNSFYFVEAKNIIHDRPMVAKNFENLVNELLRSNSPKKWFRAYFNHGLINYIYGQKRLLPCDMSFDTFFIDPYGDVMPCNGTKDKEVMGNLNNQSWDELWNSPQAEESLLTLNALTASDRLIIPVQAQFLAMRGMAKLMQVVHKVQQRLNSDLSIAGVLITQYDGRKNLNKSVSELVQETFQGKVFSTHIRNAITLAEAPTQGQDIFHYAPKSAGAEDYEKVCNELLTEIK